MERRHLDFNDFDSVSVDVGNLRQRGYTKVGNWTLGQICEHLAMGMRMSIDGDPRLRVMP